MNPALSSATETVPASSVLLLLAVTVWMAVVLASIVISPVVLISSVLVVPAICFLRPAALPYLLLLAICATGLLVVSHSELGAGLASAGWFHVTFADAVFVAALVAEVARKLLWRSPWLPWSRIDTGLCVVTAATLISAVFALDRGTGFVAVVQTLEFWILARIVAQGLERLESALAFYRFFVAVALGELALGLVQYLVADAAARREPLMAGTLSSPYLFGLLLGWAAMIAYTQLLAKPRPLHQSAWLAAFIGLIAGLLLSGKRSQWLALTATILVLTATRWSRRAAAAVLLFIAIAAASLSLPPVREIAAGKIEQALRYEELGTQGYARYRLVQTCWQLFVANPWLGIGPKNFRAVSERYIASRETGGYSALATEQWPLGKLAEQGVVGYAAFLYLMYVLLQQSFQVMRRQPLDRVTVTLFAFFVYITAELGEWFATERGHINFIFIGLLMAATYRGSPSARPQAVDGDLA